MVYLRPAEEYHYDDATDGRLLGAEFALTPRNAYGAGLPFYAFQGGEASSKAQATYQYDGGGRLTRLTYAWVTFNGTTGTRTPFMADEAVYENTGLNRGLKLSSTITAGGQSATQPRCGGGTASMKRVSAGPAETRGKLSTA